MPSEKEKPVELAAGVYIVKAPFFLSLLKVLRSGAVVFTIDEVVNTDEPSSAEQSSGA